MNQRKIKKSNIFEKHPIVTITVASVILFFATDLTFAGIYRLKAGYPWGMRNIVKTKKFERSYRTSSSIYHHGLAKNKAAKYRDETGNMLHVYVNSLGFRDGDTNKISLDTDKYRIVFIGDSFTEGSGMNYQNTFVGIIKSALLADGIEVLNAGVSSYCPVIYWRKVKYLIEDVGLKFDELVVFLDLSDIYDEVNHFYLDHDGNVAFRNIADEEENIISEDLPKYKKLLKYNTIFMYAVSNFINDKLFPRDYRTRYERVLWTIDKKAYRDYGMEGIKKAELSMDKLYSLLKMHNIKLTLAVYPWPDQIISDDLDSIQVSIWKAWCGKNNVSFLNYFPYFIHTTAEKDKQSVLDEYFLENNVHWNQEGHRLIADVFSDFYEKHADREGDSY